jgi:hypothetical protein
MRRIVLAFLVVLCFGIANAQMTIKSDFLIGAMKFYGKSEGEIGLEMFKTVGIGIRYAKHDSAASYNVAYMFHTSVAGSVDGPFNVSFSLGVGFLNGLFRVGGGYDFGALTENRTTRYFGYVGTSVPF